MPFLSSLISKCSFSSYKPSSWKKCLKNQPCDVIKMSEMRGEEHPWKLGAKTPLSFVPTYFEVL